MLTKGKSCGGPSTSDGGGRDIAKTVHLEQRDIEAPGRERLQHVILWTASEIDTATTVSFDTANDGPAHGLPPKLPGALEVIQATKTKQYVEVGLVIGSDPEKYKPTGNSRNKQGDVERQNRGRLARDPAAMRVFTPTYKTIPPQAKFYVGSRPRDGRLGPRLIDLKCVVFYPEIWAGIDESKPLKERQLEATKACRYHAALDKTVEERIKAPMTLDEVDKLNSTHPLAATRAQISLHLAILQYDLWKATRDPAHLQAMLDTINAPAENPKVLAHGKETLSFFDFHNPLTDEAA